MDGLQTLGKVFYYLNIQILKFEFAPLGLERASFPRPKGEYRLPEAAASDLISVQGKDDLYFLGISNKVKHEFRLPFALIILKFLNTF